MFVNLLVMPVVLPSIEKIKIDHNLKACLMSLLYIFILFPLRKTHSLAAGVAVKTTIPTDEWPPRGQNGQVEAAAAGYGRKMANISFGIASYKMGRRRTGFSALKHHGLVTRRGVFMLFAVYGVVSAVGRLGIMWMITHVEMGVWV